MFSEFFLFAFLWFSSFFLHEVMHCFEAWRQHVSEFFIVPDFKNFTMYAFSKNEIPNPVFVHFAGGVYTSIFLFVLSIFTTGFNSFCFLTLGWVQLCYGIFEGFCLGRMNNFRYTVFRYSLYVSVVLICYHLFYGVIV